MYGKFWCWKSSYKAKTHKLIQNWKCKWWLSYKCMKFAKKRRRKCQLSIKENSPTTYILNTLWMENSIVIINHSTNRRIYCRKYASIPPHFLQIIFLSSTYLKFIINVRNMKYVYRNVIIMLVQFYATHIWEMYVQHSM